MKPMSVLEGRSSDWDCRPAFAFYRKVGQRCSRQRRRAHCTDSASPRRSSKQLETKRLRAVGGIACNTAKSCLTLTWIGVWCIFSFLYFCAVHLLAWKGNIIDERSRCWLDVSGYCGGWRSHEKKRITYCTYLKKSTYGTVLVAISSCTVAGTTVSGTCTFKDRCGPDVPTSRHHQP